jgi:hypothetical protein
MVKQYPHYLFAVKTTESKQGEDGYWSDGESSIELLSMCREETDGRGAEVQTADGTYRRFSSLIQIPKGALVIAPGTNVFVSEDEAGEVVRINGVALKFDKGQLHSRLWV